MAEDPQPESGKPASAIQLAGFTINGRFDLNYEKGAFSGEEIGDGESSLKNYHHFVFLSRKKREEPFSFTAEVVDLTFYEMAARFGGKKDKQVRFGKIFLPFGADPLFHHSYGGVSGFDQKLVRFIWAELGAALSHPIRQSGDLRIDNELYLVSGYKGKEDSVLAISGAGDPGTPALGDRLRIGKGKYSLWASTYWDPYEGGNNLFMYGIDAAASYGFIPVSALENLSVKLGFIRADVESEPLGNYYHFGDYLQLDCKLPSDLRARYRTGAVTFENHGSLFFDTDRKDAKDTVSHTLALYWDYKLLSLGAEFIANLEAANEVNDDLVRLSAVLEF